MLLNMGNCIPCFCDTIVLEVPFIAATYLINFKETSGVRGGWWQGGRRKGSKRNM